MSLVRTDIAARTAAEVSPTDPPSGYGPDDLRNAYNVPASSSGLTVAIVDAYDWPKAESDLAIYRSEYGLPECSTANGCFRQVNQRGQNYDYPNWDYKWGREIDLDIDMVSAICPSCHILLVEADTDDEVNLGAAVNTAVAMGALVVSNSYDQYGEDAGNLNYDAEWYDHPGVAIVASAGDSGYGVAYPAVSSDVIAVGGTTLVRDSSSRGWSESAWSGTGSGCSQYEPKPAWQSDKCSGRTEVDVSAVADPGTGVATFDYSYGWGVLGGTSAAAPIIAAMYALGGNPGANPAALLYERAGDFNDVTTGSNGTCGQFWSQTYYLCNAVAGYDGPTGLGTPNGIAAFKPTAATLSVSGIASPTVAGTAESVTVMAQDQYGNAVTDYQGTIHFTSSDAQATVPADYTFTVGAGGDNGTHTFTTYYTCTGSCTIPEPHPVLVLRTAGTQTVTATDTSTSSITGAEAGIVVNPAAATHFVVAGIPSPVAAGVAHNVTVTAQDKYDNTDSNYVGTVHFSSSDTAAVLPANTTLTGGVGTFSVTFNTAGTQSVTATDTVDGSITGSQSGIMVTVGQGSGSVSITSTAPANPVVGGTYQVTYLAGPSTSPVVLSIAGSSSSVCSINGSGLVSFNAVGSCEIDADQAADTNWTVAHASQTLTVGQGSQTISFGSAPSSVTVGASGFSVRATATSGLAVTYSSKTTSICSVDPTSGALTLLGAGKCTIAADQLGNANWNPAPQATQSVTVNLVPTTLAYTGPTATTTGTSITLSATLKTSAGVAISNRTISFTLNGATLTATTNSSGVASVKTTAPAKVGTYPISVAFAADTMYAAASASATLKVTIATTLNYLGSTSAATGASITLSAWLRAGPVTPVSGKTVAFTINGVTKTATTNFLGIASVGTTAPATTGTYSITVAFAGDTTYAAASTSATLTVTKPVPVLAYTGSTNAAHGASITLSATLKTSSGAGLSNRTISFTLNGATLTATTNSSGVASVKTTAPAKAGTYPITVAFAGDTTYAAASTSVSLRVR